MTRDTAREMAVQIVFGLTHGVSDTSSFLDDFFSDEHFPSMAQESELFSEKPEGEALSYIRQVVFGVDGHREEIDGYIQRYSSSAWNINRISGTALAVLRVAVFEILYLDDVPAPAAINSAVEIDKGYDEPETVAFVNGVLGGFVRGESKV